MTNQQDSPELQIIKKSLAKRRRKETIFVAISRFTIFLIVAIVVFLIGSIFANGYKAFYQYEMRVDLQAENTSLRKVVKQTLYAQFPDVTTRADKKNLTKIASNKAHYDLKRQFNANNKQYGEYWVPVDDAVDQYLKGNAQPSESSKINLKKAGWIDKMQASGAIRSGFNYRLFIYGDSREPEMAGLKGAFVGSLLIISITLVLSIFIGVLAAVYLEEFAPRNRLTAFIEININNLAAVPSIVFGLLGLVVFINVFGLPRSASIVASFTLTLMTLPTIILSTRTSMRTVPPSLKEAACGLGASRMQVVCHHTIPYAMPGILTGSIIGIAQALGETAPLIMIGMVAFIADTPQSVLDAAPSLPVQIYLWADSPEKAFVEKASAAIIFLLVLLFSINILAIILRDKFDQK